jgi:hypothetical protein
MDGWTVPESLHEKRAYDYVDGRSYIHSEPEKSSVFRELAFNVIVLPLEPPGQSLRNSL